MPFPTDRVRLLLFLRRRPGITADEFTKYWAEEHAPLFASMDIVKKNILKYEWISVVISPFCDDLEDNAITKQAYTNPASSTLAQAMQLNALDFDGVVVLEANSAEKLTELFGSEEYVQKIASDGPDFLDCAKCQICLQQFDSADV